MSEHKMPIDWQKRHLRATVAAGATVFRAQSPLMFAVSKDIADRESAEALADQMDAIFWSCPPHQWPAAAQAMQAAQ